MGTPSQVRSGKTLERWTARWLQSLGFPKAARSHQDRQGSVQLGCVPDIIGVPVWVECKRLKHAKLESDAAAQAKQAEMRDAKPKDEGGGKSDASMLAVAQGLEAIGRGHEAMAAALSKPKTIHRGPDGKALGIQ